MFGPKKRQIKIYRNSGTKFIERTKLMEETEPGAE